MVKLIIKDEVNVKFEGLDLFARKKYMNKYKYQVPYARHMPSYKLGRWDGCVNFFSLGGVTYLRLLEDILVEMEKDGIVIEDIEDHRIAHDFKFEQVKEDSYSHFVWPKGHPDAGNPITLRDYQVEAINRYLSEPQCIQEISTGAGKTILSAVLASRIEAYGRSIVLVPNKDLVTQTERDFKLLGLDAGVYFGDRKELNKQHTICTWQSLNNLYKKSRDEDLEHDIHDFLDNVICVMVDEAHMAKADVVKQQMGTVFAQVPIRWGMTGTIPKEDFERMSLVVSVGPVVGKIAAADLQEKGVLASCHVNIIQIQDFKEFGNYQEELKYLLTNPNRLENISNLVAQIAEDGNTLVLVDRISAGEELCAQLGDRAVFVNGAMKSSDRRDHYDEVSEADGKIIVATYGVAAVGINIPRIFNLVLLEPGKSFVRVIQSIGRGIRKAEDKDFVQIWDITSNCKFAKRHLTKRKTFYNDAKYPWSLTKTVL